MRRFALLSAVLALVPALAGAQVPHKLGYQGRLLKADGTPETGVVQVNFSLFGQTSGGSALWTETQSLALTDGFYATELGATTEVPLPGSSELFLEVSVGGTPLTPRHSLASVPFALAADTARNLASGASLDVSQLKIGGQTVIDSSGKLAGSATYQAGSGLALNGNTFSLITSCQAGEVLHWNGTTWACGADGGATYSAGTGLQLDGNVFALNKSCGNGQILKWNGSAWACSDDFGGTVTSVTASAPLLSSGGATPNLSLKTEGCSPGQALRFDGSAWACAADAVSGGYIHNQTSAAQNASFRISGDATATAFYVGLSQFGADQGGHLELGATTGAINPKTGGTPYIDFHYGNGKAEDRNVRVINDGDGRLSFEALDTTTTGNLGVATATPTARLHVVGPSAATGTGRAGGVQGQTTLSGALTAFTKEVRPGDIVVANGTSYPVVTVDSDEKMTVSVPVPSSFMNATFTVLKPTARIAAADGTLAIGVDGLGRVGIGTVTPKEKLEVQGSVLAVPVIGRWYPASATTNAAVTWNETLNTRSDYLALTSDNKGVVVKKAGLYRIAGQIYFTGGTMGDELEGYIRVNGNTFLFVSPTASTDDGVTSVTFMDVRQMSENDVVSVACATGQGNISNAHTHLIIERLN